ncbi:Panacea domain-containing protein [Actinomyces faecalis]|uniref:Panacea domain-containing protein n=1 Tax=Actinomyces faecalis TaxID=2722820 RepID=UPI001C5563FF|nr:type II toxin-antitoxin system antitoxin SocA domain-containing protein [Actinomyces faecalis]
MAYSPTMVANNALMRAFQERQYITPMKLQKILYFVASEYAKRTGRPLLAERFQTWRFGPVSYTVYDEFRPFARKGVKKFARDASGKALIIDGESDSNLRDCLDEVWEAAKQKTAVQLSEITHARGSAWFKAYQADRDVLDHQDMIDDTTYLAPLGLR